MAVQHPAGNQLEGERFAVYHQCVAGVVATLVPDHHGHFLGEQVGEFPLALVTPLRSNYHCCRHVGRGYLKTITLGRPESEGFPASRLQPS